MTYFKNVDSLETLRKQYKELLKKHHPDNGGNVSDMQEINAEYDRLFKQLKDKHESKQTSTDGAKADFNNMHYDFAEDKAIREMLQKIIHLSDIVIELCGSWIWISGNTYQHRKELKEIGFMYASKKKQWYWHSETFKKKSRTTLSMDDIRNYYGSTEVKTEQRILLQA